MRISLLAFLLLLLLVCARPSDTSIPIPSGGPSLTRLIDSLHLDVAALKIVITKSSYELVVWHRERMVKRYPCVFGFNPTDDKRKEGDGCTPEGTFYMQDKYPHKAWSKFIWINYPTADSWRKHRAAKEDGTLAASARIGGEIGIHGVPAGYDHLIDARQNWTLGCISLKNQDVNEIYPYIRKSTPIIIQH